MRDSTRRSWSCSTKYEAMDAATTPNSAMPVIMRTTATAGPATVTGYWSPWPTLVTVTAAHHSAPP